MLISPLIDVEFNRLRAVFPMQDRAPFGFTDFLGVYASAGFPRIGLNGVPYSGNDSYVSGGDQGGCEFDPLAQALYPRSIWVPHENVYDADSYGSGAAPPSATPSFDPTFIWYDLSTSGGSSTTDATKIVPYFVTPPGFQSLRLVYGQPEIDFDTGGLTDFGLGTWDLKGEGGNGVGCQGFTCLLTPYSKGDTSGLLPYLSIAFRVIGSGNGRIRWYSVALHIGGKPRFGYNDVDDGSGFPDPSGWVFTDYIKTGSTRVEQFQPPTKGVMPILDTSGNPEPIPGVGTPDPMLPIAIEVRAMGGQIRVLIGAEDTPYMWPHPQNDGNGTPDWQIDKWLLHGNDLIGADFSVHLTKWECNASTISQDINTGIALSDEQISNARFITHYSPMIAATSGQLASTEPYSSDQIGFHPPGVTASAELYDVAGTVIRYRLVFNNPVASFYRDLYYSDYTAAVRAVTVDIPGTVISILNPPTILGQPDGLPLPDVVDIWWEFNLDSLSASSRCSMTFNNFQGIWTNGTGTGFLDLSGHFAAQVNMAILSADPATPTLFKTEFTGIANTSFENNWGGMGRDSVTVHCKDCWAMLDEPCWNLPWFDGWNVYAVIRYLANIGTITDSQIGFIDFVPDEVFAPSPGLDYADNNYMPVGVAGSPLTRFGSGMKMRDIMLKISVSIGYTLYFDVFGILQFYKFAGDTFSTAPVKNFWERPGAFGTGEQGMDEVIQGNYGQDLGDVRNSVTVIGVNALGPLWSQLVAHSVDLDSIYDDSFANYKGWPSPMVWADNLFSGSLDFAQAAADSMLNYLRVPPKTVTFTAWYPGGPSVYPGDTVNVGYSRSAATLYTYFVLSTHVRMAAGQMPTLDITACLVPGLNGY